MTSEVAVIQAVQKLDIGALEIGTWKKLAPEGLFWEVDIVRNTITFKVMEHGIHCELKFKFYDVDRLIGDEHLRNTDRSLCIVLFGPPHFSCKVRRHGTTGLRSLLCRDFTGGNATKYREIKIRAPVSAYNDFFRMYEEDRTWGVGGKYTVGLPRVDYSKTYIGMISKHSTFANPVAGNMDDFLHRLPSEIMISIARHLNGSDVFALQRTTKKLHNILDNNKFWEILCQRKFGPDDLMPKVKKPLKKNQNTSKDEPEFSWRKRYIELWLTTCNCGKPGSPNSKVAFLRGDVVCDTCVDADRNRMTSRRLLDYLVFDADLSADIAQARRLVSPYARWILDEAASCNPEIMEIENEIAQEKSKWRILSNGKRIH